VGGCVGIEVEFDMSTQAGLVTVEEYLKLPEPQGGHYELHHGEVVLVPPPKRGHHRAQVRIREVVKSLVGDKGVVEIEFGFRPAAEYEVWVADVAFVTAARDSATGDDEYLVGAPDLVVEVLSPSNSAIEINEKMAICLKNGCASFWVADPKSKHLFVTEGTVTHHYSVADSFYCEVLGATISVREFFE
jgi:Uma2 family endonuclease